MGTIGSYCVRQSVSPSVRQSQPLAVTYSEDPWSYSDEILYVGAVLGGLVPFGG